MSTTPYMELILPDVSSTIGPDWAAELNTALAAIDAHDHTSGKGLQIPTAGISINADFPFNGYNAITARSYRMSNQGSPLVLATDVGCLYEAGGNLYYNNAAGTAIQITAGAALNATSIGGIGGDYSTSTASEFYTSAAQTFSFWANTNLPAFIDCGPVKLRKNSASSNAITLKPATAIAADYNFILPAGLPGGTSLLSIDSSGNLAFTNTLTLSGFAVTGAFTLTGNMGITGVLTVTGNLLDGTDSTHTIGDATHNFKRLFLDNAATDGGEVFFNAGGSGLLSTADGLDLQLATFTHFRPATDQGATLGTTTVKWGSLGIGTNIGSGTPAANFLFPDMIPKARATTSAGGTIQEGVNLTVVKGTTGLFTYTLKTGMANGNYTCVVSAFIGTAYTAIISGTSFEVHTGDFAGTAADKAHSVVVFGTQ